MKTQKGLQASKIPRSSPKVVKKTPFGNAANRGPPTTQAAAKATSIPRVNSGSPCEFPAMAAMSVTPRSKSRKNAIKMKHDPKAVVPFSEAPSDHTL